MGASFTDYVRYFFSGYKTESMSPAVLAFLAAIRNTLLTSLALVIINVYDAIAKGNFDIWNWEAWQSYLLPALMFLLSLAVEWARKHINPSVSLSALPQSQQQTRPAEMPPRG